MARPDSNFLVTVLAVRRDDDVHPAVLRATSIIQVRRNRLAFALTDGDNPRPRNARTDKNCSDIRSATLREILVVGSGADVVSMTHNADSRRRIFVQAGRQDLQVRAQHGAHGVAVKGEQDRLGHANNQFIAGVDDVDRAIGETALQFGRLLVQVIPYGSPDSGADNRTCKGTFAALFGIVARGGAGYADLP